MFRIKMAKGTKVSRATSLVTSMELKKGSSTSMSARKRSVFLPRSRRSASASNRPQPRSPATTAIRQKSRHSTRKSK